MHAQAQVPTAPLPFDSVPVAPSTADLAANLAAAPAHPPPSSPRSGGSSVINCVASAMVSSKLRRTAPCSSGTKLPPDLLFEVLLCLPAKELCRLRVVCHSWHALTTDPLFIKVHASRHTDPLFAVTFSDGKSNWNSNDTIHGISIMDMSGNVLKRIPISKDFAWISVLRTHLSLICICLPGKGIRVLNPTTEECELVPSWQCNHLMTHAFGLVASTGQYKMLRIVHPEPESHDPGMHLCEVMTLDRSNHRTWRRKQCAPVIVSQYKRRGGLMKNVVLHGIVYFMMDEDISEPAGLVPFNLETEEWMPIIRGPELLQSLVGEEKLYTSYFYLNCDLSVANLSGCLVTVHNVYDYSIDLWFLMDVESGIWVKKYSVVIQHAGLFSHHDAYPLLVLDSGRIVFYKPLHCYLRYDPETGTYKPKMDLLQIYDPQTNAYTNLLEIKNSRSPCVSIYTGSPLSLKSD